MADGSGDALAPTATALGLSAAGNVTTIVANSTGNETDVTGEGFLSIASTIPDNGVSDTAEDPLEDALTRAGLDAIVKATTTIADIGDRAAGAIGDDNKSSSTASAEAEPILFGLRKEYVIIIVLAVLAVVLTVIFFIIILVKRRALARRRQNENLPESVPLKSSKA